MYTQKELKLHSVLFGRSEAYTKMAGVLELSAAEHSPKTPLTLHQIDDDDCDVLDRVNDYVREKPTYLDNIRKSKHHCQIVCDAKDGEYLCLIDADTMVLGDMSLIFDQDFHLTVTSRRQLGRFPINSGVVFVRVSSTTKRWYEKWYENVQILMADEALLKTYHTKYGGINQCALGMLMEANRTLPVREVPCYLWNCTSDVLDRFKPNGVTKVVHIHGTLRRQAVYNSRVGSARVNKLISIWRSYARKVKIA